MAFDDVFTYSTFEPLPVDEEVSLISRAQQGDEEATVALLRAYGPALRSAVSTFVSRFPSDDYPQAVEEARAEAVAALFEVIHDHDPETSPRLAGAVQPAVLHRLGELARLEVPLNIPKRTLTRFYGILRAAEGDVDFAADLAPTMGMTFETFEQVRRAVHETLSIDYWWDEAQPDSSDDGHDLLDSQIVTEIYQPYTEVEDRLMVETAFRAVDDTEARVIELGFGFTEYEPVPDGEIGHRLGVSRLKVLRTRKSGLGKMRKAIGAPEIPDPVYPIRDEHDDRVLPDTTIITTRKAA